MEYGRNIGEGLWIDNLPILEGTGRLTNPEFKLHCADILEAVALTNASRVKLLQPKDGPLIQLKVFEALILYADPDGPIHKRAPIAELGYYVGCQWPAILVKRLTDGKVIMVSRQKVRVHESI